MTAKKKVRLPGKMSELIRVGVADMRKVRKQPDIYTINMGRWHSRIGAGGKKLKRCFVCFAGSVMAKTLRQGSYTELNAWDERFDKDTTRKLVALDFLRRGYVHRAAAELKKSDAIISKIYSHDLHLFPVPNRADDTTISWETFERAMLDLADRLEAIRL